MLEMDKTQQYFITHIFHAFKTSKHSVLEQMDWNLLRSYKIG